MKFGLNVSRSNNFGARFGKETAYAPAIATPAHNQKRARSSSFNKLDARPMARSGWSFCSTIATEGLTYVKAFVNATLAKAELPTAITKTARYSFPPRALISRRFHQRTGNIKRMSIKCSARTMNELGSQFVR